MPLYCSDLFFSRDNLVTVLAAASHRSCCSRTLCCPVAVVDRLNDRVLVALGNKSSLMCSMLGVMLRRCPLQLGSWFPLRCCCSYRLPEHSKNYSKLPGLPLSEFLDGNILFFPPPFHVLYFPEAAFTGKDLLLSTFSPSTLIFDLGIVDVRLPSHCSGRSASVF